MKGNMLLGHARGSVGDVVFARYKGQQTAHSRARSPQNPKTEAQVLQRSLFIDVVKFYTRGVQNLFKFAFENKSAKESDFNAFMRYNTKNGVNISQKAYNEPTYPALGNFMMSQGSLRNIPLSYNNVDGWSFTLAGMTTTSPTVAKFTNAMISAYECKEGDLFTVVMILADGSNSANTPDADPEKRDQVTWKIRQIRLSNSDTKTIDSYLGGIDLSYKNNKITFDDTYNDDCCGIAVLLSRDSSKIVKVSNSYMILNDTAQSAYEDAKKQEYIDEVLASWNANGKTILQGSLS